MIELIFKEKNGIGVLQNEYYIDMSFSKFVKFNVDKHFNGLELNGKKRYEIVDGIAEIKVKDFVLGTNTLRAINNNKIIPLQPIFVSRVDDKFNCTLATNLDFMSDLKELRLQIEMVEEFVEFVKSMKLVDVVKKLNTLIEINNKLQERVADLEKNYDPTV